MINIRLLSKIALLEKRDDFLQSGKQFLRTMCKHMAEGIAFRFVKKGPFSKQSDFRKKSIVQIQWTCGQLEEARTISVALVEKRLVACAQIIPQMESFFLWKGKVDFAQEVKVFFKTQAHQFFAVREYIETHCSYEVPEISQIAIEECNPAYLNWLEEVIPSGKD